MALVQGAYTSDRRIPSASTYSFTHTQDTGTGRRLVLIIASPSIAVSSVTYGGQAMTSKADLSNAAYSTFWRVFELVDPPTGSNTVAVTMASAQYNPVSSFAVSFTGCAGVGNVAYDFTAALPCQEAITISANSMVIGNAIGGNNTSAYVEIPNDTARTLLYNANINNSTWGAISPSLASGSTLCEVGATANATILLVEVKEAAATATRRVFVVG